MERLVELGEALALFGQPDDDNVVTCLCIAREAIDRAALSLLSAPECQCDEQCSCLCGDEMRVYDSAVYLVSRIIYYIDTNNETEMLRTIQRNRPS